jgi:hypothetical protein
VRSKKAPFANIATMLCERANNKVLTLKYPCLTSSKNKRKEKSLYQSIPIKRVERDNPSEYYQHLSAICDYLEIDFDMSLMIERLGKCMISEDVTLRSRISEEAGQASRSSRYFEAKEGGRLIFGEAMAFYFMPDHNCSLVVYCPLVKTTEVLRRWHGEWSKDFKVLEISSLSKLVGVWVRESRVHILRSHAGMDMLNVEEYDIEE